MTPTSKNIRIATFLLGIFTTIFLLVNAQITFNVDGIFKEHPSQTKTEQPVRKDQQTSPIENTIQSHMLKSNFIASFISILAE